MERLEKVNTELKVCLNEAKNREDMNTSEALYSEVFERPIVAPGYLLFSVVSKLGVEDQISQILMRYNFLKL